MLSNRTCAFSTGLFLFYYFQTVCYNKNMSDNKTLNKAKREKYNEYGYFDEDKNPVGYEVDFGFSEFYDEEDEEDKEDAE